jgi:hypothetical protein
MKIKITLLFFLVASSLNAFTYGELLDAMIQVESGGNAKALNISEKAYGVLQIRPIMIQDFNRIYGTNVKHKDAFNPKVARVIALGIFAHYGKNIPNPNAKHFAFIWNGGGSAWKRVDSPKYDKKQRNLERYWKKIAKIIESQPKKN